MATSLQSVRFDSRVSLWNSRQHAQATSQDSFDRVKVLSPSLVDCLLQRTTQDRVETSDKSCTLEKFNGLIGDGIKLSQALPYMRSATVSGFNAPLIVQHISKHKSLPKLRVIRLLHLDMYRGHVIVECRFLYNLDQQLQSFTYKGGTPIELISSAVVMMPRLKTLKFELGSPFQMPVLSEFWSKNDCIPWNELTTFSFQNDYAVHFYNGHQLLHSLRKMTRLRRLALKLSFKPQLPLRLPSGMLNVFKLFLEHEIGKIDKFYELEVLSFGVEPSPTDATLDYRFVLGLFLPKFGASLKKLIFQVPHTLESTSNCILLDYSNEFPHLKTLILKYPDGDLLPTLLSSEDKRTPSLSIRHLTIRDFNQKSFSSIFEQIPTIFPNLVELNLKVRENQEKDIFTHLTDQDTSKMISRLANLRTLRFMDDHSKLPCLYGSIDLMCKRATELKPKVAMMFRVPIGDGELKHLKYFIDQLPDEMKPFYCWEKAAKWIRLC